MLGIIETKKTQKLKFGVIRGKKEDHDGPVLLHWLIHKIPSYQTIQYLEIDLKHKIGLKLVAIVLKISKDFTRSI